ncbi:MAG: TldD/PmbA family protein [Nitrospirae bacterium]|nr:TldD/PmbA family protein [Nitrospirota bacterium]
MEIDAFLAQEILEKAKGKGVTAGDVLIAEGDHFTGKIRLSQIDQISEARERQLGLRLFFEKRSATAATSDFSPASLERLIEDTCDLARATAFDEYSGLPEEISLAKPPDLSLYDPKVHDLTLEDRIQMAMTAEKSAFDTDPRITNSEGAEFANRYTHVIYANTHGFVGSYRTSSFILSVSPIASQNGVMQRDSWYSFKRRFDLLERPESVGRIAAQRTVRRIGARKVATCQVPVIFDPETAATLLHNLFMALSGYSIYKGASFLAGEIGKTIASDRITLYDDGTIPMGLGSKPFDGEGTPTRKTLIMDKGVLMSYLLDSYSGRKLGLPSTGNAARGVGDPPSVSPTNFYLTPGARTPEEMIRSIKSGLYVTELIGFGFNPVTGDYSRGVSGHWIENGELAFPVEEITIAGNFREMLMQIEQVGNDLEFNHKISSPTLLIGRMTVAGH